MRYFEDFKQDEKIVLFLGKIGNDDIVSLFSLSLVRPQAA